MNMDLTVATDVLSCPACHVDMRPEFRTEANYTTIVIRARCPRCGRFWKGHLGQVREDRIYA